MRKKVHESTFICCPKWGRGGGTTLLPWRWSGTGIRPSVQERLRGVNRPVQGDPKAKCDNYRNKRPTPEPSAQASVTPAHRTAHFAQTDLLSLALVPRQWRQAVTLCSLLSSCLPSHTDTWSISSSSTALDHLPAQSPLYQQRRRSRAEAESVPAGGLVAACITCSHEKRGWPVALHHPHPAPRPQLQGDSGKRTVTQAAGGAWG